MAHMNLRCNVAQDVAHRADADALPAFAATKKRSFMKLSNLSLAAKALVLAAASLSFAATAEVCHPPASTCASAAASAASGVYPSVYSSVYSSIYASVYSACMQSPYVSSSACHQSASSVAAQNAPAAAQSAASSAYNQAYSSCMAAIVPCQP